MPDLKIRMLFISHAWQYDDGYKTMVKWFNDEPNFYWKNSSIPKTDALPDKTTAGLKRGITAQISPAQGVVIVAGMYAAHSDWIEYEIKEAQRLGKVIIGVKPWGNERMPQIVQDAASIVVGWNSASVITAIRSKI